MRLFISLLIAINLYSIELQTALDTAIINNPSINMLQEEIKSSDFDIQNSSLEKNPALYGGVNDINFHKPTKRDIEPMQSTFIGISQEFSTNDKLSISRRIKQLDQEILKKSLEIKKSQIKLKIYEIFFRHKLNTNKIYLMQKEIKNLKKIKNFYANQMQNSKSFFKTFEIDQKIQDLGIKIDKLRYQNSDLRFALEEILSIKIKKISTHIKYKNPNPAKEILLSDLITLKKLKIKKQKVLKSLYKEKKAPNITLNIGYFKRDDFDDYLSLGFKLPLAIRGREDNEVQKSITALNSAIFSLQDMKNRVKREYEALKQKITWLNRAIWRLVQSQRALKKQKRLINIRVSNNSIADKYKDRLFSF